MKPVSTVLQLSGGLALLLLVAVAFTPAAMVASHWLEQPPRLEPAAAIVVLGGGGVHSDGRLSDVSLRRTLHGIHLHRRGLAPLLVLSGPRTDSGFVEGEIRAATARALGVPAAAIQTETSARTTHEEARRMAAVLLPRGAQRILLVVDAQGMRRATGVFRQAGFEPLPAAIDDVSRSDGTPAARLILAHRVLIELAAIVYYRLAGYL